MDTVKSMTTRFYWANKAKARGEDAPIYQPNSFSSARLAGLFTKLPSTKYPLGQPIIKNVTNNNGQ